MVKKIIINGQEIDASQRPVKFTPTSNGKFIVKYVLDGDSVPEGMFDNLEKLEEIDVKEGVKSIGDAFNGCKNLKKVKISKSVTKIQSDVFGECENIEEVVFDGTTPPQLQGENQDLVLPLNTKIVVPSESENNYKNQIPQLAGNILTESDVDEEVEYEFDTDIHIGDIFYYDLTEKHLCVAPRDYEDPNPKRYIGVIGKVNLSGDRVRATIIALHNVGPDGTESDYSDITPDKFRSDLVLFCDTTIPDIDEKIFEMRDTLGALPHFPIIEETNGVFNYDIKKHDDWCFVPTDDLSSGIPQMKDGYIRYPKDAGTFVYTKSTIDGKEEPFTCSPYVKEKISGRAQENYENMNSIWYTDSPNEGDGDFGNAFRHEIGLAQTRAMAEVLTADGKPYFPAAYIANHYYPQGWSNWEGMWYIPSPYECACFIARLKEINLSLEAVGGDAFKEKKIWIDGTDYNLPTSYPILTSQSCGKQTTGNIYTSGQVCVAAFMATHELFAWVVNDSSYKLRPVMSVLLPTNTVIKRTGRII